jgi:hypothetical protein
MITKERIKKELAEIKENMTKASEVLNGKA